MNEAEIRWKLLDFMLEACGRGVVEGQCKCRKVFFKPITEPVVEKVQPPFDDLRI